MTKLGCAMQVQWQQQQRPVPRVSSWASVSPKHLTYSSPAKLCNISFKSGLLTTFKNGKTKAYRNYVICLKAQADKDKTSYQWCSIILYEFREHLTHSRRKLSYNQWILELQHQALFCEDPYRISINSL